MFLKLENDHYASFYNNQAMEVCFEFNPLHCPRDMITFCFEADIIDDLRSFLKRFGVQMNENESKLQFYLFPSGNIGPRS